MIMTLKSTFGRGELEGILSARASSCCEISNSWDNLRSGHCLVISLTVYWEHFWVIGCTPFQYLGSDRMDFLVNSEYLASDSSRPLLRPPFDFFFLWPFFASWSSLPFWLFEACFVGLWPFPIGIWPFVVDIWPFAVDIWPFEVDIWPFAVKPTFGGWSLEIPVIFKLVVLFALQGDDGCSMRLLILQITSISFLFFQSRNVEQMGHSVYHSNHFINHYYMVAHCPNVAIHFSLFLSTSWDFHPAWCHFTGQLFLRFTAWQQSHFSRKKRRQLRPLLFWSFWEKSKIWRQEILDLATREIHSSALSLS